MVRRRWWDQQRRLNGAAMEMWSHEQAHAGECQSTVFWWKDTNIKWIKEKEKGEKGPFFSDADLCWSGKRVKVTLTSAKIPLEIRNKWKIFSTKHWSFYTGTPSRDRNLWLILIKMALFIMKSNNCGSRGGFRGCEKVIGEKRKQSIHHHHHWEQVQLAESEQNWIQPNCLAPNMRQSKKK